VGVEVDPVEDLDASERLPDPPDLEVEAGQQSFTS
jgi:hypothetical protein